MAFSRNVQKSQRPDLFYLLAFLGVWLHRLFFSCSPIEARATITGVHSNQDQILLVKIREYIGFMLIEGPDYYGPPECESRMGFFWPKHF